MLDGISDRTLGIILIIVIITVVLLLCYLIYRCCIPQGNIRTTNQPGIKNGGRQTSKSHLLNENSEKQKSATATLNSKHKGGSSTVLNEDSKRSLVSDQRRQANIPMGNIAKEDSSRSFNDGSRRMQSTNPSSGRSIKPDSISKGTHPEIGGSNSKRPQVNPSTYQNNPPQPPIRQPPNLPQPLEKPLKINNESMPRTNASAQSSTAGFTQETLTGTQNEPWTLPGFLEISGLSDFRLSKQVARGDNAKIYLADVFEDSMRQRADVVIAKQLYRIDKPSIAGNWDSLQREVALIYKFNNDPFIVKMVGYAPETSTILLFNYPLGNLQQWITNPRSQKSKVILMRVIMDISYGITALHKQLLVHASIKPSHVLIYKASIPPQYAKENENNVYDKNNSIISNDVSAVITDFQHCKYVGMANGSNNPQQMAASKLGEGFKRPKISMYACPEAVMKYDATFSWDIYGLGHIVYTTLTRKKQ